MMQKLELSQFELSQSGIPDMEKLSGRLTKLTGWRVVPVLELVPDDIFSITLPIAVFPREPLFVLKKSWTISRSPTSFTTFSARGPAQRAALTKPY
jgi:phenylalanine-4-hydroxylase